MTNRWLTRIVGGVAALMLSVALILPLAHSGIFNKKTDAVPVACDCSKCRSGQSCCPTAGGQCGCFPFKCP